MTLWTKRAIKDYDQLPEKLQRTADDVIERLVASPTGGTKLKGKLAGKWAVRLGRSIRILYDFTDGDIRILTIQPRRDVYR